ncbi:Lrp/AsnC family leucine-responsive transcriptional regulator [Clostridium tetanomorphum]|uniref:Lrp/AsnC family transcriptional regulator n=1 Tax=Clostridium tetanomorphum TaxID=1553 RepID=A0A923J1F3_CLOTT|nr:Lrp/AsnC family transcriptional regulator [Clostridium tetanomorphum]KAJ51707.1 transcriptional regulator [Clostridium tetanomorphum DSM 665]MBC2399117.1 Lrp/AsnC family transcriptional regulator [Clostridium tetanomorphum]MBP1865927.1 Lrp/AsnC family leucine-responsive transcriptional regulator [Clostridium tetanomorphum]NRS86108.1 Lrp/AsnC family leucine-responsive transcriptional regulator [Clostridium tetanomorphum]NRZ95871.1 Lrp/AsnC family leucine-responsive transcriptional regulator 
MDSTDHKIIEVLLEDGRISMKELAKKVSLSAPAAAERVRRLEEAGIIKGYKAIIDYEKIGQTINVLINVDMKIQENEKFMEFIKTEHSIIECHHVTGPYCKILKARLTDMPSLEKLIGKIQVFGNTETFIILSSTIKDIIIIAPKSVL